MLGCIVVHLIRLQLYPIPTSTVSLLVVFPIYFSAQARDPEISFLLATRPVEFTTEGLFGPYAISPHMATVLAVRGEVTRRLRAALSLGDKAHLLALKRAIVRASDGGAEYAFVYPNSLVHIADVRLYFLIF